ncbi:MAG: hypothetical protein A2945_04305 [Candidatus Liptonbacteria bacterium RIFCSPLOWO2_01_FULL_52_25]|uniref:Uncharacterized protein n=1 Tax=Candidatus Liptonbacteria bacterium RIFCSPLOWO2_01_FULL_52_25 TaxID=1798650 RepID=A0A1G2CF66_9BACT|nr:MAG: hypothetical protein A2945_04305 [Candidatus Liptonbacteria bacterium RIFCSPLOWO2_01_FULL_52_25]
MRELSLSGKTTLKAEAAPPPLAITRHPKEKFCLRFRICARPIFSSKRKTKLFFDVLLSPSRAAGLASF